MIDIPSISAIVAAAGVIVGVVFTIVELRNLVKTRQTDLVIRLYSTFGSKEFQRELTRTLNVEYKGYNDFVKKEGLVAAEAGMFFEGVGVLLHRKLIDITLVDDLFSGPIKMTWEKFKPLIKDARKQLNQPQYAEWVEYLYNEMHKREQTLQAQQ